MSEVWKVGASKNAKDEGFAKTFIEKSKTFVWVLRWGVHRSYFRGGQNLYAMKLKKVRNPGVLFVMVTTLFVTAVVTGCERVDIGSGRPSPVDEPEEEETLLFTGVRYPEGYDWNRDPEYGSVQCILFLASADGGTLLERKVGTAHMVASDSDMHRILGGSLWEDWSTDAETIVTRDGVEQFRWQGRECISEALLCGGRLYTLGSSREDGGMCLRRDGVLQMGSGTIDPVPPLHEDNGAVCLAATSTSGGSRTWYAIREGAAMVISPPVEKALVCGVHFFNGKLGLVTKRLGGVYESWIGNSNTLLGVETAAMTFDRVVSDGSDVFIFARKWQKSGPWKPVVWHNAKLFWEAPDGFELFSFSQDGGDMCFLGRDSRSGLWQLVHGGEISLIPEPYRPYSRDAILLHDGAVYLSLVRDDSVPVLWMDGEIREYEFNGYIDHFEMVIPPHGS